MHTHALLTLFSFVCESIAHVNVGCRERKAHVSPSNIRNYTAAFSLIGQMIFSSAVPCSMLPLT